MSAVGALARRPAACAAAGFLAVLVLACLVAPLLAHDDPRAQDLARVLAGPGGGHPLGTDTLGRDVLSRLLFGGRRSLLSVAEAVAVVLALGVPLGLVAGYAGGRVDSMLSRAAEIVLSIPAIILVLVVLAMVPRNEDVAMVTFGILGAPAVLRVVRGATLRVREELYVAAARVAGLTHARIIGRHVLPAVAGPIVVQASIFCAYALLFETGLAFLGLTADPATPTWGGMVAEASTVIEQQSWLLVPSGIVIALAILAFGMVGDGLRDVATRDEQTTARRRRRRRGPAASVHEPPPERADALLSVGDLSVRLADGAREIPIVDRVSFEVAAGETVGLVGESGCGKSVTALALLRLLDPELHVSGGRAIWDGQDLLTLRGRDFDRLRGSALGFVSQEPQSSLDPTFSVGSQLVELVRRHDGGTRRAARQRALELLRLVELPDPERVSRAHAHELSGGMAQRVAIALALAGRPQLLVADEPTTALDVTVQREILGLLRGLGDDTGMALLLITHDWGVVADLCDRTLVMYAGQIVEQAEAARLFDQPLHPYTAGLLASHPSRGQAGEALVALAGGVPAPGDWPTGCRFAPRCRFASDACRADSITLHHPEPGRTSRCIKVKQVKAEALAS